MVEPAFMPINNIEDTIASMDLDTSAWTVPWAATVDKNGRTWLTPSFFISETPGGTVQMRVHRHQNGNYSIEIPNDAKYTVSGKIPTNNIPVQSIKYSGHTEKQMWERSRHYDTDGEA